MFITCNSSFFSAAFKNSMAINHVNVRNTQLLLHKNP